MHFVDRVPFSSNVTILKKARNGKVVDRRDSHNVFIDTGRKWLRQLVGVASYAGIPHATAGDGANMTGDNGQSGNTDSVAVGGRTYRPRYIGRGVGGILQSVTPPGKGAQVEEGDIVTLESPVKVSGGGSDVWLQEVLPQGDVSDLEIYPTAFSIRFRAVYDLGDVSFAGQVLDLGTDVPISEIGLFTSEAFRGASPDGTGLIAYNIFKPISKTPNFVLEIAWELRF